MAVGACGKPRSGFPSDSWARASTGASASTAPAVIWPGRSIKVSDAGRSRGGPGLDLRTLVTVSSSDRSSQSKQLCHGFGSASSRSAACGLRRRGSPSSPEDLSSLWPTLCDLSGV